MRLLLDRAARAVPIAVLDFEMTGLDPERDRVCEVAVVRGTPGRPVRELASLVRPGCKMSKGARKVHGITDAMLTSAPRFEEIADDLLAALDGAVLVCHNVPFDLGFLHRELAAVGRKLDPPVTIDTLLIARRLFAFRRNNLATVCETLGVSLDDHHRAMGDARATFSVYSKMIELLDPDGGVTVGELLGLLGALAPNSPLRLRQQAMLVDALRERRTVFVDYQSTGSSDHGIVRREIGIWHLALPYIQAWCYLREGERVFRLDRIRKVVPGERTYSIPEFEIRI